ncbi:alternative oxidase-domain-containing protein [Tuber brumale]|nr:alternative oxidase-domain-containing protein [Tuber brumale]
MLSTTTIRASAPAILATKHLLLTSGTRVVSCGLLHGVQTRKFTGSTNSFFLATTPKSNQERPLKAFRERSFPHPVYTEAQMNDIKIAHRKAKTWGDWVALAAVRVMRKCFDLATGYKHDLEIASGNKTPYGTNAFHMTPQKWLARFIFLESIAGVPGMAAGMIRHLNSLRRLKRDNAWIETLLEEAYNERLHLLTFLHYRQPGLFMRTMILGAQGVFFNLFFVSYLISPRTCHRFVGYIEEEAVITYTRAIADIENGRIPEWENLLAPDIAIKYFGLGPGANMLELLRVIRADEAKHREVNHTLANLSQDEDPNPYALIYEDGKPHPTKGLDFMKPEGWEKGDIDGGAAEEYMKPGKEWKTGGKPAGGAPTSSGTTTTASQVA